MIYFDKNNHKTLGLIVALFILYTTALLQFDSCNKAIETIIPDGSPSKEILLRDSTIAHQKLQLMVSGLAMENYVEQNKKLSLMVSQAKLGTVKTVVKTITELRIDTVKVFFKDSIKERFEPKSIRVENKNYSFDFYLTNKFWEITNMTIPDTAYFVTSKKFRLFKPNETLLTINHSNKFIKTKGMESITVKEEKKWYDKKTLWFSVGAVSAILTMYAINR